MKDAADSRPLQPGEQKPTKGFHPMRLHLSATGLTIVCTRPVMHIGRHSTCDIRLPLPDVSRRHCRLAFRDAAWTVIDLGSTNGVEVNGRRVVESPLATGDKLRVGGFTFDVEMLKGDAAPSPDEDVLQSIAATLAALNGVKSDLRHAG